MEFLTSFFLLTEKQKQHRLFKLKSMGLHNIWLQHTFLSLFIIFLIHEIDSSVILNCLFLSFVISSSNSIPNFIVIHFVVFMHYKYKLLVSAFPSYNSADSTIHLQHIGSILSILGARTKQSY